MFFNSTVAGKAVGVEDGADVAREVDLGGSEGSENEEKNERAFHERDVMKIREKGGEFIA